MGKLRIEPKVKPPVTKEEYDYYKKLLAEARSASDSSNVYYDLDEGEQPRKVRRALQLSTCTRCIYAALCASLAKFLLGAFSQRSRRYLILSSVFSVAQLSGRTNPVITGLFIVMLLPFIMPICTAKGYSR